MKLSFFAFNSGKADQYFESQNNIEGCSDDYERSSLRHKIHCKPVHRLNC